MKDTFKELLAWALIGVIGVGLMYLLLYAVGSIL
jgi:hypothetical protein